MRITKGRGVVMLIRNAKKIGLVGLLFASVSLAGCNQIHWLPGWDDTEKKHEQTSEETVVDLSEKFAAYNDAPFLYVSKEEFVERFNTSSSDFVIDKVEESNEANNLVFHLKSKTGDAMNDGIFLIAENNPVQDKMIDVSLAHYGESALVDGKDKAIYFDLLKGVYNGLHQEDTEHLTFVDTVSFVGEYSDVMREYTSFTHNDYDVYAERSNEGVLIAFHARGTFTNYEHEQFALSK